MTTLNLLELPVTYNHFLPAGNSFNRLKVQNLGMYYERQIKTLSISIYLLNHKIIVYKTSHWKIRTNNNNRDDKLGDIYFNEKLRYIISILSHQIITNKGKKNIFFFLQNKKISKIFQDFCKRTAAF